VGDHPLELSSFISWSIPRSVNNSTKEDCLMSDSGGKKNNPSTLCSPSLCSLLLLVDDNAVNNSVFAHRITSLHRRITILLLAVVVAVVAVVVATLFSS
jgi:hypothetical protein